MHPRCHRVQAHGVSNLVAEHAQRQNELKLKCDELSATKLEVATNPNPTPNPNPNPNPNRNRKPNRNPNPNPNRNPNRIPDPNQVARQLKMTENYAKKVQKSNERVAAAEAAREAAKVSS